MGRVEQFICVIKTFCYKAYGARRYSLLDIVQELWWKEKKRENFNDNQGKEINVVTDEK